MMNHNVVQLRRPKKVYPDLWPKHNIQSIAHMLHRNQPTDRVPSQTYLYALKPDFKGQVVAVIVQPNETVLYNAGKDDKFSKWFSRNLRALKELSIDGFRGVIVGKMKETGDNLVLVVYYVIQDHEVFLDEVNIDHLLKIHDGGYTGSLIAMPISRFAPIHINKELGEITVRELFSGFTTSIVGFPVVAHGARTAMDGSVAAPDIAISTDIHMSYMGFVHHV